MRLPTLSVQIGIGLATGLALGLAASAAGDGVLQRTVLVLEVPGTVWLNGLRMCVVPLVLSALVAGVGSIGDVRKLGRVGLRTLAFFLVTITAAGLIGMLVASVLVPLSPVDPQTAASLRASAAAGAGRVTELAGQVRGMRQFILDLVPVNPVKAAADGALLPLTLFAVVFGAAAGTLDAEPRGRVLGFFDALTSALIRLIHWVMALAPLGVLCLVAAVTARIGWQTLQTLLVFVLAVMAGAVLIAVAVYGPSVGLLARMRPGRFARAITPGATVAFTTASSMAALPTMLDSALRDLRISSAVAGFVLPVGATLNRPGSALYHMCAVIFVGALYGIPVGPLALVTALATSLLMTFSVASVPSATVFTTAPVLLAVGLPVESIALLLGVDRIPDMFRTGLNAIGHQTAAAVVARAEGEVLA
jgi:proton glutamate symport protein